MLDIKLDVLEDEEYACLGVLLEVVLDLSDHVDGVEVLLLTLQLQH